jgi:TonB family protein
MSTNPTGQERGSRSARSANDRFKAGWNWRLSGSIGLVALLHLMVLVYMPRIEVDTLESEPDAVAELVRIAALAAAGTTAPVREISIPVPALPTVDDVDFDGILTPSLEMPDFTDTSILNQALLPKLESEEEAWHDYRKFAPFVVRPMIRNRTELKRFLERHYQPILEYSGATGVVHVFFYIDESGLVQKAEIAESSGSRSLDRLAMRLSKVLRFSPAMLAGRPIRMQVRLPITFRAA